MATLLVTSLADRLARTVSAAVVPKVIARSLTRLVPVGRSPWERPAVTAGPLRGERSSNLHGTGAACSCLCESAAAHVLWRDQSARVDQPESVSHLCSISDRSESVC